MSVRWPNQALLLPCSHWPECESCATTALVSTKNPASELTIPMARLAPPTAVLFDVGDTLLIEERFDLEAGIAAAVGPRVDVSELAHAFRAELARSHQACRELWLASWLQQRVPSLAHESVDGIEDRIWPPVVTLSPAPGIAAVLSRLASDGVPMAAVSNASFSSRILMAELVRHRLATSLRFVLSSADIGLRKPAPEMFRSALHRLGVAAEGAWFVGDTPEEDIVGATAVGLTCFLMRPRTGAGRVAEGCCILTDWAAFYDTYVGTAHSSPQAS
jgi:FMN phosphatase YigB (HAD superfamily)